MSLVSYTPCTPTEVPMEVSVLFTTFIVIMGILANGAPQAHEEPVMFLDAEAQKEEQKPPVPKRSTIHIPLRSPSKEPLARDSSPPPQVHVPISRTDPLEEKILSILAANSCPLTARKIGSLINLHKSYINKSLYSLKKYSKVIEVGKEGSAPLWVLA